MFLSINTEDVYIGYSLEELSKVRDCLALNNIRYKYKIVSHSSHSRGRSGSLGINMNYEKQYVVYVENKNYERAKYLVDRTLNRL